MTCYISSYRGNQDGLVVTMSAYYAVGHGFASQPCHTKDHHNKNGTNCLPAWHAGIRALTVLPHCLKGWVLHGTVYGGMYTLKISWLSIIRVGYSIPVSYFYLVLHGRHWRKMHSNGLINQSINHTDN